MAAGLAAVQVGKHYNVFCILYEDPRRYELIINPKVEIVSTLQSLGREGCLSIPRIEEDILRFKKIKVRYLDRDGHVKKSTFTGYESREIQHEHDHTKGILFTDRV